jgi:O-antigen/teichoic acid export membrane protein
MPNLRYIVPAWVWQVLLMGLLGLSGVIFVPVLLRLADPQLMATVLVAQVYVHYLVVLVQYGFAFSGPAAVARAIEAADVAQVWRSSVKVKLLVLAGPVMVVFGLGYACMAWGQWYVGVFAALLCAYALNSNWLLQAQQRFAAAAGFAAVGVLLSACLLFALTRYHEWFEIQSLGSVAVLVLVLPQVCVGTGTWCAARKACKSESMHQTSLTDSMHLLRKDWPLVVSQLLLLASTTLGTVVVGALADANTTAAYAATEKLFNLGATVLVGLYMALYPQFSVWFYANRDTYWKRILSLLGLCIAGASGLALLLSWTGDVLLNLYLPAGLAEYALPALVPFVLWLGLCIAQHMLTGYLVLAERNGLVLWVNAGVLSVTVVVGWFCALSSPVTWVYGMLTGQILAVLLLLKLSRHDKAVCI